MSKYKETIEKINRDIISTLSNKEKSYIDEIKDENVVYLMSTDYGFICLKEDTTITEVKCCYCLMAIVKEYRHTDYLSN